MAHTGAKEIECQPLPLVLYALPDEMRFFSRPHSQWAATGERERLLTLRDACAASSHAHSSSGREGATGNVPIPDAYFTSPHTLCVGVGAERAERRTRLFLENGPPISVVIIVGFAGGLADDLFPGSMVIADKIVNSITGTHYSVSGRLLDAAKQVSLPGFVMRSGLLATTDRVLIEASEKQRFARETGALAVDMESAGVAAALAVSGVPLMAIRVITDGVADNLPLDFNALTDSEGNVDRGRIVAVTLLRPWKIPALVRLGHRSTLAARNLAHFLEQFLTRIPE